eukprot:CAMPEP_0184860304 /NCGR_PEP_ID=MMETSP0580-20130426/5218_1 /TAXON_ID=1118495 /ORGANISM="Dactyliosolen fragilissimus" /LENGTH=164 /DNA_ID=CAMNT_0027357361 /DNA_START=30 /DNA_END=524 /DNA_ORIENTATION=-
MNMNYMGQRNQEVLPRPMGEGDYGAYMGRSQMQVSNIRQDIRSLMGPSQGVRSSNDIEMRQDIITPRMRQQKNDMAMYLRQNNNMDRAYGDLPADSYGPMARSQGWSTGYDNLGRRQAEYYPGMRTRQPSTLRQHRDSGMASTTSFDNIPEEDNRLARLSRGMY